MITYDVEFRRVAYFPTTLRTYCMKGLLMVSCWDDMQVKVVDLISGQMKYILEKNEPHESRHETPSGGLHASVKAICAGADFIAVGYEWQRYIKACPLRVYNITTGERIHCLPANGASPQCLAIHDEDRLLFASSAHQKGVSVFCLDHGTKLYTIPCKEKVVDFTLRKSSYLLYVRSNLNGYVGYFSGKDLIHSTSRQATVGLTVWDFSIDDEIKSSDSDSHSGGQETKIQLKSGRVQKRAKKRASRI